MNRSADSAPPGRGAPKLESSLLALTAVLVPNLALLACGQYFFLQRAWINVDYVPLALLGLIPSLHRVWLLALVAAVFSVDILFAFAPAYHFTPGSLVQSVYSLLDLGPGFIALHAAALLGAAAIAAWLFVALIRRVRRPAPALVTVLLFGAAVAVLDPIASGSMLRLNQAAIAVPNLGFSTALNTAIAVKASTVSNAPAPSAVGIPSASDPVHDLIDSGRRMPPLIVLVNVESLGLFESPALNNHQLAPLTALEDDPDWQVTFGSVPFEGSTVAGELRELCSIRYLTVEPQLEDELASRCLVNQLQELGYRTLALHGFQGTMFSRNRWYPRLGFDQVLFGSDMMQRFDDLERCGSAFEGICDASAWEAVVQTAQTTPKPAFIYWMTLTAHLPVLPHASLQHRKACRDLPELNRSPELCDHLEWHRSLFRQISSSVQNDDLGDMRLILVGDHPPPFLDQARHGLFSDTHVPYVDIRSAGAD